MELVIIARKRKSGYQGLGGNSFQKDMERGLGKQGSDSGEPQGFNQSFGGLGGNSFGEDVDSGLGKQPQQKKKSGHKNILDEWNDAAGGGW